MSGNYDIGMAIITLNQNLLAIAVIAVKLQIEGVRILWEVLCYPQHTYKFGLLLSHVGGKG